MPFCALPLTRMTPNSFHTDWAENFLNPISIVKITGEFPTNTKSLQVLLFCLLSLKESFCPFLPWYLQLRMIFSSETVNSITSVSLFPRSTGISHFLASPKVAGRCLSTTTLSSRRIWVVVLVVLRVCFPFAHFKQIYHFLHLIMSPALLFGRGCPKWWQAMIGWRWNGVGNLLGWLLFPNFWPI